MVTDRVYIGTTNPNQGFEEGDSLYFDWTRLVAPEFEGVVPLEHHTGDGFILALTADAKNEREIIGTAVMIAPGVAVTATHVLEEMKAAGKDSAPWAMGMRSDRSLTIWRIVHSVHSPGSDVSVVCLQPMIDKSNLTEIRLPTLNSRVPEVGDRLSVIGFREGDIVSPITGKKLLMLASSGRVTESYPNGRDRVMMPFPCVEVDLMTIGGMSGGPVFDDFGCLVGIVSTSVDGDLPKPTFVSLIWPILLARVSPVWPSGLVPADTRLIDFGTLMRIYGRHRVSEDSGNLKLDRSTPESRNEPCYCGSKLRFKHCHGAAS